MGKRRARHGRGTSTLTPLPSLLEPDKPPEVQIASHKAMRGEWTDPQDDRPSAARVARTVRGHRAYDPIRWSIARHGSRSNFTTDHVAAADALRVCFDGARLGFSALRDWRPVTALTFRPSTGPSATALKQVKSRRAFDAAWARFRDPERALLLGCVLRNLSISKVAALTRQTASRITARLVVALDLLAQHFEIREPRRRAA
jgi:hypothetical protein